MSINHNLCINNLILHVQSKGKAPSTDQTPGRQQAQDRADSSVGNQPQALPHPARISVSRRSPSQKPVSQLQQANPREFQLGQVLKRFSPARSETQDGTLLTFSLAPSDPDFPFELQGGLRCSLTVPAGYPQHGKPTIRITNAEMARGFQINVENGFDSLVASSPQKTLLALLNDLDRNLEKFLTTERAQTIKIIANADKRFEGSHPLPEPTRHRSPSPVSVALVSPTWTPQQKSDALAKRQADVRQLEARMSRMPNFSKSPDGTAFNVPVQIPKVARLPSSLQSLKEVTLLVPKLYNLEPCTVLLKGVSGPEVEKVQLAFERHARGKRDMTLMAHVNYLTQNMYSMVSETAETAESSESHVQTEQSAIEEPKPEVLLGKEPEPRQEYLEEERPHVKFIPRPPEWDRHDSKDETEGSSYDSDDYSDTDDDEDEGEDEDDDGDDEQGGASLPVPAVSTSTDKGIHLSFPHLELHNIELLTLVSLSLSVKCLRCKTPSDVSKIKASSTGDDAGPVASSTRTESCPKCSTSFTFLYVPNTLHANTIRAGTIEATGCTITDMLPSVFQPTCSSCSTAFPVPPGVVSVRGDTPIQVCRSCHAKMTFTIHEVKFLRVSHTSAALPLRRPRKENLGISAGTPLPSNGTCPHYRHSYRWFRFSCCNRVHACDRCHDAAEAHVNERAERMVCGWCSREQRFRRDDCGLCGRSLTRQRKVGGFWEGGQGTRERRLMSRKEKRKYKRPCAKAGAAAQGTKHVKKDG
ncbi:CHY zinc finger domain protein [Cladophialophora carrionii]|uniref:CHY zinc finger domain protein n=1 Tax=Cladophialophora carrionii TaxID=86049 RepID=A0A1C1CYP2_9EURO|nr:CHY zinc finger domain protein [Cladophialophora carrionii]